MIATNKEKLILEIESTLSRLTGLCDQLRGHSRGNAQRRATEILLDYARNAAAYNRKPLEPFSRSMRAAGLYTPVKTLAASAEAAADE